MDTLTIDDLKVMTKIGVSEEERRLKQQLLISVQFQIDTRAAAKEDDAALSVNYADAARAIRALAETERKTIERFAEDIAAALLPAFAAKSIMVKIRKFALPDAASASITIVRP